MHFCIQWQITARKEIQCQAYFILNNLMSYIQYRNARRNGKHRVSSEKSVANFEIDLYQIIFMNIMHIVVFGKSLYIVAVDLLEALEKMILNQP